MLVDSNILIYALNTASPKCRQSQIFLSENGSKLVIAQQNIMETLRVITHSRFEFPFSREQALRAVQEISSVVSIIQPYFQTTEIALRLIAKYQISGNQIFDAYLVATALSHKITHIVSDNSRHLKKYSEVVVVNPFENQK